MLQNIFSSTFLLKLGISIFISVVHAPEFVLDFEELLYRWESIPKDSVLHMPQLSLFSSNCCSFYKYTIGPKPIVQPSSTSCSCSHLLLLSSFVSDLLQAAALTLLLLFLTLPYTSLLQGTPGTHCDYNTTHNSYIFSILVGFLFLAL